MITLIVQSLLTAYAFFVPITLSLAEPLSLVALAVWLVGIALGKSAPALRNPLSWPVTLFLAVAVLASLFGARPEVSVPKLSRFLLLGVIWMIPSTLSSEAGLLRLLKAFVAGAIVKGFYDLVRVPSAVLGGASLFQTGNMREPQIYAVALLLVLGLVLCRRRSVREPAVLLSLLVLTGGLLVHFKRGAWLAFIISAVVLMILSGRRRGILVVLLLAVGFLALPQVRDRLSMVDQEFSLKHKGRYSLWTIVAPKLIRQYPFGMGWKAMRYEDLRGETRWVQKKLNHLHDNALQVTVELGWMGLAAWLFWMFRTGTVLVRAYRRAPPGGAALALGAFGAFLALLLNGIVEYNFGDSEIFMMLCLLMGIAAALHQEDDALPSC